LPFAYAAIKPMFTPRSVFDRLKREGLDLPMPPALPGLLAAGRIPEAVRVAQERARASGLPAPFLDRRDRQALYRAPDHRAPDPHFGRRLLAALVIPVSSGVVRACLDQAYPSSDQEPQNAD
jgi:CRISPR-associated protein Csx17